MGANRVVDGAEPGGADPAEPSLPASDRTNESISGERVVLFTDAVTAISITLLVLPLVDLVPEAASAHEHASEVITGHLDQIWSFLLSFAVIANIWREHHRTFSSVTKFTRSLMMWNMGWLLSVVVLPVPTEMIGTFGQDRFVATFYYTTLLVGMVCRYAMLRILKTTPALMEEDSAAARRRTEDLYTESYLNVLALVIALAIALAVPVLQYYSLLLLAILPRLARLRRRRTAL